MKFTKTFYSSNIKHLIEQVSLFESTLEYEVVIANNITKLNDERSLDCKYVQTIVYKKLN